MITGYPEQLYTQLTLELELIQGLSLTEEKVIENQFTICLQYHQKLLNWQKAIRFWEESDEIYFYKFVQPKFTGRILYFKKRYQAILFLPPDPKLQIPFYEYELDKTEKFFQDNAAVYQYFKSGAAEKDRLYFIRESPQNQEPNPVAGEIIGYEQYKEFLREKLATLELEIIKSGNQK